MTESKPELETILFASARASVHFALMCLQSPARAGEPTNSPLRAAATHLAAWLFAHTPLLPNGWAPRRIIPDGQPFPFTSHEKPDEDSDLERGIYR